MTTPTYLDGLLAPVVDEITAENLQVSGTIPQELRGRYFRNGPNPKPGEDPGHWFVGPGMIHGIRLRDGKAEWYRNRWVRTAQLAGRPFVGPEGPDLTAVSANTNVIRHADKIFALVENGFPHEITPELFTVGAYDFKGRLTTAMTAHPKEDPDTGELHFFGYGFWAPYLTYHRLNAQGDLVESREIDVPGPTMMHDFAITEHYVVWLDLPMVFDLESAGKGMAYQWSDEYGARLGVMSKQTKQVQWFDVDPCYVFHVGNAHEDEGRVVLDAVRYSPRQMKAMWARIGGSPNPANETDGTTLHRWTLDLASGGIKEEQLDDRHVEFPSMNELHLGRPSQYLYAVTGNAIVKYDTVTGRTDARELGRAPGEAEFVPRMDARFEDDGWLMSIVTDHDGTSSDLMIFEAVGLDWVAKIHLPRRVPSGFHGNWLADS